jgi:uncharacterized membrane protein
MTEVNRPDGGATGLTEGLPTNRLAREAKNFLEAFAERALASVGGMVTQKVSEATSGLLAQVGEQGGPGVKAAVSGVTALAEGKSPARAALGAGMTGIKEKIKQIFKGGGGKKGGLKLTNIVETIDVGVPLRLVYDQWSQFEDFPSFMKKVENAERPSEEKSNWKAQVWWSHRNWEATIIEQVPDDHIIWRSKGAKGHVDGAVSFSELAPNLTRICLVLEYHPQGLFERTGNLWRAQGRRARLELKHFRRHMMAHAVLEPDDIEGWRGEIRDGEVVKTHEEAMDEEEERRRPEEEEEEEGAEAPGEEEEGEEEPEEEEPGEPAAEEEEEEAGEDEEPEESSRRRRAAETAETPPEEEPEDEERPRRPRRRPAGQEEDEESEEPRRPSRRRRTAETPPEEESEDEEPPRRPSRRRRATETAETPPEEESEDEERPRRPRRRPAGRGEDEEPEGPPRRPAARRRRTAETAETPARARRRRPPAREDEGETE